jgi:tellurite resistance protein
VARREALREVMPYADDSLVDHILELGIQPETALAMTFLPLVMVAWADGEISPSEREALLRAAEERGVKPGTPPRDVLESWLERQPGSTMVEAWKRYVRSISTDLSDEERIAIRGRMLGLAREVAEAAGGFLGLISKISAAEQKVLDEIEQILS